MVYFSNYRRGEGDNRRTISIVCAMDLCSDAMLRGCQSSVRLLRLQPLHHLRSWSDREASWRQTPSWSLRTYSHHPLAPDHAAIAESKPQSSTTSPCSTHRLLEVPSGRVPESVHAPLAGQHPWFHLEDLCEGGS